MSITSEQNQYEPDIKQLSTLARDIFATRTDELHGDDIERMMILSAEARLTEVESQERYPALWHHFHFDQDALAEYRLMAELVELEVTEQLAVPTQVPLVPSEHRSWIDRIGEAITIVFTGFQTATSSAVRGETLGIEPVEVSLIEDMLYLELDVEINERDPFLRDLFCRIETEDDTLVDAVEYAPIRLQIVPGGPIIAEATFDELGDAVFSGIAPATYYVQLQLRTEHYEIAEVKLP